MPGMAGGWYFSKQVHFKKLFSSFGHTNILPFIGNQWLGKAPVPWPPIPAGAIARAVR